MTRARRRAAVAVALLVLAALVVVVVLGDRGASPRPDRVVRQGAVDDGGRPLSALSVVADPDGGWLGVYHWPTGDGPADFAVGLARSDDLFSWRRLAVLDRDGGNMPTLHRLPDGGFLLAYEDYVRVEGKNAISRIRVQAFPDRTALLRDAPSAERELPITQSENNEGTPSVESVEWGGSPAASTIVLRFHYNADAKGIDRQAVGTLRGFRDWAARPDRTLDRLLSRAGFPASHGRRASFRLAGRPWMLVEVQRRPADFGTWRLALVDRGPAPRADPVPVCGGAGVRTAPSVGVPAVAPIDGGRGLLLSAFVFDGPTAGAYLRRIPVPLDLPADPRRVAALFGGCGSPVG